MSGKDEMSTDGKRKEEKSRQKGFRRGKGGKTGNKKGAGINTTPNLKALACYAIQARTRLFHCK